MTLPGSPSLLQVDGWIPSERCFLAPTLIIPCESTGRIATLQKSLALRLNQYITDGICWLPNLESSVAVNDQAIEQLGRFRDQSLWEELLRKGYVEHIPSQKYPIKIQTIVICDLLDVSTQNETKKRLSELTASIQKKNSGQSVNNLVLVVLGSPIEDTESLQAYFPCYYLSATGTGGVQTDSNRILQVCQNLVVALSTSEISRFINTFVINQNGKRKARWISIGASSVLADINPMQARFNLEVLSQFTEKLVSEPLTEAQKKLLDHSVEQKRRGFQNGLLFEDLPTENNAVIPWTVKSIALNSGWDITFSDKEREPGVIKDKDKRYGCYISYDSVLAKNLFGKGVEWWLDERISELKILKTDSFLEAVWKRIKFSRDRFVDLFHSVPLPDAARNESILNDSYQELTNNLYMNLAGNANKQHGHLIDTLSFLIERRSYIGDAPLDINTQWPTGIQAAQYWAGKIAERLSRSSILLYGTEEIDAAKSGDKEFCKAGAHADITTMEALINQYRRFRRSILSPLGITLKLIIAYPLITGLFDLFLAWDLKLIAVLSLLGTFFLGLIDFIYWRFKERGFLISVRSQINELLAKRVLSLIARVIQDFRLRSAVYFPRIQTLLSELSVLLRDEHQRISEVVGQGIVDVGQIDQGAIYRLSDYARALGTRSIEVDDQYEWGALKGEVAFVFEDSESGKTILSWKSEAKRSANASASQNSNGRFEKIEIEFIDRYVRSLIKKERLASTVLLDLKSISADYALQEFKIQELSSYILAEKCDDLRNGLKWKWLRERATPLGGRTENYSTFNVISVPDELPLTSKAGRSSEHWSQDAQVITSRQMNEIGCIRGIIEWEN